MSLDKDVEQKESEKEEKEITKDNKKYSLIKDKLSELKNKYEEFESEEKEIIIEKIYEINEYNTKKINVPIKLLQKNNIEKERDELPYNKRLSENDLSIHNSLDNSTNKNDYTNMSESVLRVLTSFNSQNSFASFSAGRNDELSSIDYEIKKSKFIKDVSPFPEENEEEEISDNKNIGENILNYTNIQKLKIPKLIEGEFIIIEKETIPLIKKYEEYFNQDSGEIKITKITNKISNNSINYENKADDNLKKIYSNYNEETIRKKWKYFIKLFIIEQNRKIDEYRKIILRALMKFKLSNGYNYNNKNCINNEYIIMNKKIMKNEEEIKDQLIEREPLIDIINENEIMNDINLFRKQKKLGVNTKEIETKTITKVIKEKNIKNNKIRENFLNLVK